MPLSDRTIAAAKKRGKPYELADRDGLFIEVLPGGSKVFRYRYRLFGNRQKVTIGQYPAISLSKARELHAAYRALVANGRSPARSKQDEQTAEAQAESFTEFAEFWLADSHTSKDWRQNQLLWLNRDIYPQIGSRRLKDVTSHDVLTLVDKIKLRSAPHSALRVRGIIKQVFDYAIARQRVTFNPAASIPS